MEFESPRLTEGLDATEELLAFESIKRELDEWEEEVKKEKKQEG